MAFHLLLLLSLCLTSLSAHAEIFKYRDHAGKLYITDQKLAFPYQLIAKFKPLAAIHKTYSNSSYKKNKKKYFPHIKKAASKYSIDAHLLYAIVDTESAFNPQAISKAGAVGLMQLMPKTAQSLGVKNSLNPSQNIHGGARYFRQLLDTFNQDIKLSLAAYNAGESAVKRAGYAIPNYPETQHYVQKVLQRYNTLKK